MKKVLVVCVAVWMGIVLYGCGSKTDVAEHMRSRATVNKEQANLQFSLAKDWERGRDLVESGKERIEDGEELMGDAQDDYDKGKAAMKRGQREVEEGRELMMASERRYRENFGEILPVEQK
jgi:hypothetical protein